MPVLRGGQTDSGLDRALREAMDAGLHDVLESGERWPGERGAFAPVERRPFDPGARPWQLGFEEQPGPTGDDARDAVRRGDGGDGVPRPTAVAAEALAADAPPLDADPTSPGARYRAEFAFRPDLVGVVMVPGSGPHLAGQTLLEWVRPIITLLADASEADPGLERVPVSDPVFRSNIDFSGETFPGGQLRLPRRTDVPPGDPRGVERRWIVTEAWWAS